jgi:hypothetical protein
MPELRRRCRDCRWWRPRSGCIHPEIIKAAKALAVIPPKAQIYRHTDCPKFEREEVRECAPKLF